MYNRESKILYVVNTIATVKLFTMGFIKYNRDQLLKLSAGRPSLQNKEAIENLKQFNLFHYRGSRVRVVSEHWIEMMVLILKNQNNYAKQSIQ